MATQPKLEDYSNTAPATSSLGDNPALAALRAVMPVQEEKPAKPAAKKEAAMPSENEIIRDKKAKAKGKTTLTESNDNPKAVAARPRTRRSAVPADKRSPIERLLKGENGTRAEIEGMMLRVEVSPSHEGDARKLVVVSNKDDEALGRFVYASELSQEEVFFRPGSSEKLYDERAKLHSLLRGLALEAGLVDKVAKKATGISWEERLMAPGAIGLDYIEPRHTQGGPTRILRQDRVSPHLAKVYAGIEGLFDAPVDRKVRVGEFEFLVEVREHDDKDDERRYKVTRAPEDRFLGIWVTHANIVRSRTAWLSEKMSDGFSAMKLELHALLRDMAIDAGIIDGKKAIKHDAITDQDVVLASIKDGQPGKYFVDGIYEDDNGNAESAVVLLTDNDKGHMQIVLLSGRGGYFKDRPMDVVEGDEVNATEIRAGARISHRDFTRRTRPQWMQTGKTAFVGRFADWLEEVVYF